MAHPSGAMASAAQTVELCPDDTDRIMLFAKAAAELLDRGQSAEAANRQLQELWEVLEELL